MAYYESIMVDWQYRYYNLNLPVQITPNRERIEDKWTDLQSITTPDEARAGRPSSCCVTTVLNQIS